MGWSVGESVVVIRLILDDEAEVAVEEGLRLWNWNIGLVVCEVVIKLVDGSLEGLVVAFCDGVGDGTLVDGRRVGISVGEEEGLSKGGAVGLRVGWIVEGRLVGCLDESLDGFLDEIDEGVEVAPST